MRWPVGAVIRPWDLTGARLGAFGPIDRNGERIMIPIAVAPEEEASTDAAGKVVIKLRSPVRLERLLWREISPDGSVSDWQPVVERPVQGGEAIPFALPAGPPGVVHLDFRAKRANPTSGSPSTSTSGARRHELRVRRTEKSRSTGRNSPTERRRDSFHEPDAEIGQELARLDAIDKVLEALPVSRWRRLWWPAVAALVCLAVVWALWTVTIEALGVLGVRTGVFLAVQAATVHLRVSGEWEGSERVRLADGRVRIEHAALTFSDPHQGFATLPDGAWVDVKAAGATLQDLRLEPGTELTLDRADDEVLPCTLWAAARLAAYWSTGPSP